MVIDIIVKNRLAMTLIRSFEEAVPTPLSPNPLSIRNDTTPST
jgi:hypothetical protein